MRISPMGNVDLILNAFLRGTVKTHLRIPAMVTNRPPEKHTQSTILCTRGSFAFYNIGREILMRSTTH